MENTTRQPLEESQRKHFSLVALRLRDDHEHTILKVGEWYFFNDLYKPSEDNESLVPNEKSEFRDFYGRNISVSAIVGKNGSGKSSILEIIYKLAYNFFIIKNDLRKELCQVFAELFFCVGDQLYCLNNNLIHKVEPKGESQLVYDDETVCSMFYNVVSNFAINALNPYEHQNQKFYVDFQNEKRNKQNWVQDIYYFADDVRCPVVFSPDKRDSTFDAAYQRNVSRAETLALFRYMDKVQSEAGHTDLIPGYTFHGIDYCFDHDVFDKFYNNLKDKRGPNYFAGGSIAQQIVDAFYKNGDSHIHLMIQNSPYELLYFLIYEICSYLRIVAKRKGISFQNTYLNDFSIYCPGSKEFKQLIKNEIIEGQFCEGSDAFRVRQILTFMAFLTEFGVLPSKDLNDWSYEDYDEWLKKDEVNTIWKFPSYHEDDMASILAYLPPMCYRPTICLKKENEERPIPIEKLSTGERQLISNYVAVFSPLHNLIIKKKDKDSVDQNTIDSTEYQNVNLILDEIELSYHPEYQRQFLNNLIEFLNNSKLTDYFNFNIILVTHSPFILSDIPSSNVLFLKEGMPENGENVAKKKTLGANIYDMLDDGFFMEKSIGEYVQRQIDKLLKTFKDITNDETREEALSVFKKEQESFKYLTNHLSEEYLQKTIQYMYSYMESISKSVK